MLRKLLLENACDTKYVQNHYFEDKCSWNHQFKMLLMPNMYKIITLKANAKEIITDKMLLMPNMYKIVTLQANAQEKGTSAVLWSSTNFCSISQNMHYKAPVGAQHWKGQQSGLDMERWLTPQRNSTYKRPFTWEGNYLVRSFVCNMKRPSVKQSMKCPSELKFSDLAGYIWWTPPVSHFHDNYRLHFSDFQLYHVTLPIDPPISYCSNSCTLSLLRNIARPIVQQISFTATCSGMPYIYIYIYIYRERERERERDIYIYIYTDTKDRL